MKGASTHTSPVCDAPRGGGEVGRVLTAGGAGRMTAGRWSMKLPRNAALAEKDVMLRWRCCVQHDVYARGSETCGVEDD